MQTKSGELDVVGKNHIELELERRPHQVKVRFEGEPVQVPCNPSHPDELEYFVRERTLGGHHRNNRFYLEILWNVSSPRKIFWRIEF